MNLSCGSPVRNTAATIVTSSTTVTAAAAHAMLAALATRFLIHRYNGAPLPPTAQLHDRGYHASNTLTTISIPRDSMMIELTDKVQKRWGSALVVTSLAGLPMIGVTGLRAALGQSFRDVEPAAANPPRQTERNSATVGAAAVATTAPTLAARR